MHIKHEKLASHPTGTSLHGYTRVCVSCLWAAVAGTSPQEARDRVGLIVWVWLFRGCLPIRTIIHPASFMTCFPFPGLPSNYQFSPTDLQNLKNFCLVAQLCLTICDSLNYGPPGSSVHGDFQARILDWVAVAFSRGSSQPWDRTQVSLSSGRFFTIWATREAQEYWSR